MALAMEADDSVWTSHVFSAVVDGPGPLIDYPYQRLSETSPDGNPRGGTWHLQNVANAQSERMGPVLLHWSSYDEDDEDVRITESAPVEFTSTSFVSITNSSITSYDSDNEGWLVGTGAYARRRKYSDPDAMPNTGVIPVWCRVYAAGVAGGVNSAGIVRIQSSEHEWVDVTVPSGSTYGWIDQFGTVCCGRGPGQPSVVQIFARRTGGAGGISVRNVLVEHGETADP